MNIHTTTVPNDYSDILQLGALPIGSNRLTHRVAFKPVPEKGVLYARVPVPNEGKLNSIAVRLDGKEPSGDLLLSIADPTCDYESYFVYAFLEDIPIVTRGPKMWRKTEIRGASYSTNQGTRGFLFLLILNGPNEEILADVGLTVESA